MKKNNRKTSKGSAEVQRILDYYENQSDDEAAREIETAPMVKDAVWMRIPEELAPEVRRLLTRHRKSA
jgi:hypothetical protein